MEEKTLTALQGSIAKWEAIVAGTGSDLGTANCPLCRAFYHDDDCKDCPVMKTTGKWGCRETPYDAFSDHCTAEHDCDSDPDCPDCTRLAQAELDFLRSLLPPCTPSTAIE